ncbi:MAG: ATP-binding protein [Defluviitaleaceae bacterium]|nr:ATP-binding protein [Defluviitaleaceae bacterium]
MAKFGEKVSHRYKNRLAFRAGILYFGIPVFALVLLMVMVSRITSAVSDDFARRLARQYSIEAAANFQISTSPHFVLMQQISRSTTISRWLAGTEALENKAIAFYEIMGYTVFVPGVYMMFTSYETLQAYTFDVNLSFEEFHSWGIVRYYRPEAQWFFDTRDAEMPFIINIQRTREIGGELYIWSNHRMYYQGRFVGVVTTGTRFDGVFDSIFGDFDADNKRGYIIDRNGNVRMDSAELLAVLDDVGMATLPSIPEADYNPLLAYGINRHLQMMTHGIFQPGIYTHTAISLEGVYRYASIAPIIGTDWSIVVLSRHAGVLDSFYLPMIIAVFAVLIISVVIGNLLIRNMALVPLYRLTQSTADITEHAELFGLERNDEIGDLARTIKLSREALKYRENMLGTINQAAQILLTSNDDPMAAILKGMEIVGRSVGADRVHLWRDEIIDGELHFVLRHNWLSYGDEAKILGALGMHFPYSSRPGWLETLNRGERINRAVSEEHPENAAFMAEHGMKSLASVPLLVNNESFGSLSVTDCHRERVFTDGEMEMLASAGLMFANALIRNEQEAAMKEALEIERDTRELNQAIIDSSPYVIGIFGDDTNLFFANKQTKELFKVDDPQEVVENLYSFSPELQPCGTPTPEKAVMYAKKAFQEGYARFEWMHQLKDGELVPVECIYARIQYKGKSMILCYTLDLRELKNAMAEMKRLEVVEESDRAKSRFLARMSHEIRTPITAVLGISEIQLRSPALSRHMEEAFTKVYDSAQMLLSIVNDILDFSKIESGKMSVIEEEYEIAGLVIDAVHLHTVHLEPKNITFKVKIDENLPIRLTGDALRIRQIISNLISNAFKYTESGYVLLGLKCEKERKGYVTLVISVQDTGFGMSQEQLEAIKTSEYSRFHEREERFISGTGLGVPIVYSLVQMMNGQIDFESEAGKGTTVIVRIPQKTCGAEVLGKELASTLQSFESRPVTQRFKFVPNPMPHGKVLVVDDVDDNLFVAKGLLAFYDLSVDTCTSGQATINKIRQGNVYDIVFMDYLMPGLNGTETMRMMRAMDYDRPIVALTANAVVGQEEEFLKSGFDEFISKPIQTTRLNEVLTKYIRKQPPVAKDGIDDFLKNADVIKKLGINFAKSHKKTLPDIIQALETGDVKTAHRLAHTLKSSAGLIGENTLAQIAKAVENSLAEGKMPDQLSDLENELNRVLEGISVPEPVRPPGGKTKEDARELLNQLKTLLESKSVKCLDFLDELRLIPEAATLADQIESFDFKPALNELRTLIEALPQH